jgi:hypothetical protein
MSMCEHKFSIGEQCNQETRLGERYCKDHLAAHQSFPAQLKGFPRLTQRKVTRRNRSRVR